MDIIQNTLYGRKYEIRKGLVKYIFFKRIRKLLKPEKPLLISRHKVRDKIYVPGKPLWEGRSGCCPGHAMTSTQVKDSSKVFRSQERKPVHSDTRTCQGA